MMSCRTVFAVLVFVATAIASGAHAQFSWDGECGYQWYDCCNFGTPESPDYRSNWTIAPSPTACPDFPGPKDSVSADGDVIILFNPFAPTTVASLTTSGGFILQSRLRVIESLAVATGTFKIEAGPADSIQLMGPNSVMSIGSGATLDEEFDCWIIGQSTGLLQNNGTIRKFGANPPGHESASVLDIPVQNDGTIISYDGVLQFSRDTTNNGVIQALGDTATIQFRGPANFILDGEINGDGTVHFTNTTGGPGSATVTGDYHPANTLVSGGYATVNFEVDTDIENLTLGNPGIIGGSGDLTVDDFLWNGGYSSMVGSGTTTVQNTMLIQHDSFAGGHYTIARDLDLNGQSILDTNAVLYINDSELRNDGDWQLHGNTTIGIAAATTPVIQNFGAIRRNGGGGQSLINVAFLNFGDIAVESGDLNFDGAMESSGPITLDAGTTLLLGHKLQAIHPSGSIAGEGGVYFYNDFYSGDTTVDSMLGAYNVGTTTIQAGTMSFDTDGIIAPEKTTGTLNLIQGFGATKLQGNADLIVTDQLNWSSGEMAGTGTTFVHGPMTLNNVGYWQSLSRALELHADSPVGPQPPAPTLAINPQGTLRCIDVTLDGNVHNNGMISPGISGAPVGHLHLTGNYTQVAGGQLTLNALGPAHDQLTIDGVATLGGTLNATGFPASRGQSFVILIADEVIGTFAQVNVPSGMTVSYTATSVILQAAPGDPCPADIAPEPDGNGVVDVDDLLAVINAWGLCDKGEICSADIVPPIDGNGIVDVDDLLAVINAWGPCF